MEQILIIVLFAIAAVQFLINKILHDCIKLQEEQILFLFKSVDKILDIEIKHSEDIRKYLEGVNQDND